jgi:hypothetical protein
VARPNEVEYDRITSRLETIAALVYLARLSLSKVS